MFSNAWPSRFIAWIAAIAVIADCLYLAQRFVG
jgi:hypothetical protein